MSRYRTVSDDAQIRLTSYIEQFDEENHLELESAYPDVRTTDLSGSDRVEYSANAEALV